MWEGKRVERKRSSKRGVRVRKELEGVNQEGGGEMDMGREKGWKEPYQWKLIRKEMDVTVVP